MCSVSMLSVKNRLNTLFANFSLIIVYLQLGTLMKKIKNVNFFRFDLLVWSI